jgi:hypothetical protein
MKLAASWQHQYTCHWPNQVAEVPILVEAASETLDLPYTDLRVFRAITTRDPIALTRLRRDAIVNLTRQEYSCGTKLGDAERGKGWTNRSDNGSSKPSLHRILNLTRYIDTTRYPA